MLLLYQNRDIKESVFSPEMGTKTQLPVDFWHRFKQTLFQSCNRNLCRLTSAARYMRYIVHYICVMYIHKHVLPLQSLESPCLHGVHFRQAGRARRWPVHGVIKEITLTRTRSGEFLTIDLMDKEGATSNRTFTYLCEDLATPRVLASGQILIGGGRRLQIFSTIDNPLIAHLFPPLPVLR